MESQGILKTILSGNPVSSATWETFFKPWPRSYMTLAVGGMLYTHKLNFLFSSKMLVYTAGIQTMVVRIANREVPDQTVSSGPALFVYKAFSPCNLFSEF